ncbi:hypothetical protein GLOIN_2v1790366 [Rhizophagus clarus]|uniref:Uncharacterized protein n=1 Tax=Rhizophagus clarus TaxID=94130 RepID=A0A8H3LUJ4_9GLOM|nr:hypothetical protein GLOIN_2v1790366 [Rhizophagus clarus]
MEVFTSQYDQNRINVQLLRSKVNIKEKEIRDKNVSTEEDVEQKLDGKEMEHEELFEEYFHDELINQKFKVTY